MLASVAALVLLGCSGGAERCDECPIVGAGGRIFSTSAGGAGAAGVTGGGGFAGTVAGSGTAGSSAGTTASGGQAGTTAGGGAGHPAGAAGTPGAIGGAAGTSTGAGGTAVATGGASGRGGSAAGSTGHGGASGAAGAGAGSGGAAGGVAGAAGSSAGGGGSAGAIAGRSGAGGTAGVSGAGGGVAGAGGAGGGGPLVLSIDFIGGDTNGAAPMMDPTEVAGARPAAHWNGAADIMGALANLVQADGASTTAGVTWNSPKTGSAYGMWRNPFADAPGDVRMMNGYLDPGTVASPAVVTVNGLPTSFTAHGYDVYVYVLGGITSAVTRTYQYAIGNTSVTVSQTGPVPSTLPPFSPVPPGGGSGNYVVFKNMRNASFTLTATPGTGATLRAPVNGIQIVAPTGS